MELVKPSIGIFFWLILLFFFLSFLLFIGNTLLTHFVWNPLFRKNKNERTGGHEILVEGIQLYAYHGCLEEEGRIGSDYVVDVKMLTDFTRAAQTDDLTQTIDYVMVYRIAKEEMAIRAKLLEQVAQRIVSRLKKEFKTLRKVEVKVTKLNPPMNGHVERVSVVITE